MNITLQRKQQFTSAFFSSITFHFYFLLLQLIPKNNIQQPIPNQPLHWQDDFGELFGAKGVRYSKAPQILLKLHNAISETYRQYIGTGKDISFINMSAIYQDWLHSLGTRSAGKFLKVASTTVHSPTLLHIGLCSSTVPPLLTNGFPIPMGFQIPKIWQKSSR